MPKTLDISELHHDIEDLQKRMFEEVAVTSENPLDNPTKVEKATESTLKIIHNRVQRRLQEFEVNI